MAGEGSSLAWIADEQPADLMHGDDRAGPAVDHAEVSLGRTAARPSVEQCVHVGQAGCLGGVDGELHPDEQGPDTELARPAAAGRPEDVLDDGRDAAAVDPGDRLAQIARADQLARRPQQPGRLRSRSRPGANSRRSSSGRTVFSPAACMISGSGVFATRCDVSHVDRSRLTTSGGADLSCSSLPSVTLVML
ncbi:MAG: hypothetical protein WKF73_07590 [Nocardioidaceae bacterium]